jgi:hypothetical protein
MLSWMAGPIVDLVVLRGLFTDTALRPGAVLAARVLDRQGERGTLLLNGVRVAAKLPAELAAGDALRVRVQESSPERISLQVVPPGSPLTPADPSVAAFALMLPGGAQAQVMVDPDAAGEGAGGGAAGRRSVTLRFDSPALGRMDFVIDLDAAAVSGTVHVPVGTPTELASSAAPELERALSGALERPARVTVLPRGETLDVRA